MAEEIKYVFNADVSDLNTQLNKLNKNLESSNNAAEKAGDKLTGFSKITGKVASSFNKLGETLKGGFGIGLAVKAFDSLTSAITENQEVQDALQRGMIVIRAIATQLVQEFKPLGEFLTKVFNDPLQALKDFGTLLYENVVTRFEGLMELIPQLGKAIGLLFEGEFKEAGKVAVDAVGKVALGVENTTEKVTNMVKKVVEVSTRVSKAASNAFDISEAVVQAQKNVARLQVLYQGIVEKYDDMAEQQRQLRDDETKTIEERLAANKQLQQVLADGAAKEKQNINDRIKELNIQIAADKKNQSLQLEKLALQQELTGVTAKYRGLQSETLTNENSLKKEGLEIDKSRRESLISQTELQNEALLADKQAAVERAELIQDEVDRLTEAKRAEEDLRQTEIDQLLNIRQLRQSEFETQLSQLTVGTQAYQDALNARDEFLAESVSKEQQLQKAKETYTVKSEAEIAKAKAAAAMSGLDAASQALGGVIDLVGAESKYGKALAVTQAIINTYLGACKPGQKIFSIHQTRGITWRAPLNCLEE
jgi:hypothetical protein